MSKENNLKKVTTNMPAFKKVPTCKSMLLCNKHGLSISANCSRKIRIGDTANQLLHAPSVTFYMLAGLPATARDGELIKMQHSCYHVDTIGHPNSRYVTI